MNPRFKPYRGPSGGWGSACSVGSILLRERAPLTGALALLKQSRSRSRSRSRG